ncbi:hypothetical protein [Thalassobacillus devorans]|uniref:hypothetical protein n=1 Tax=Thalassobacillus devorans TaxID=279813 RepID=UPI000A1CE353|nr:hypothetical protein [Thalassobacillus devorans]
MMEWILSFWEANRNNIIVSFVSGLLFFILGPIGLWFSGKKVRKERILKAIDTLLDIVEGMLVSEEDISRHKLIMIFRSVERDMNVDLEAHYDLDNLLGDLVLRFERSKHLDAGQKDSYFHKIISLEQKVNGKEEQNYTNQVIPKAFTKVINELREANNINNQKQIHRLLDELEKKLSNKSSWAEQNISFLKKPKVFFMTLLLYLVFLVLVFTLISFVEGSLFL